MTDVHAAAADPDDGEARDGGGGGEHAIARELIGVPSGARTSRVRRAIVGLDEPQQHAHVGHVGDVGEHGDGRALAPQDHALDLPPENEVLRAFLEAAALGEHKTVQKMVKAANNVDDERYLEFLLAAATAQGDSALDIACFNGHARVAQLLLEAGADRERRTQHGRTALQYAEQQGHRDIVVAPSEARRRMSASGRLHTAAAAAEPNLARRSAVVVVGVAAARAAHVGRQRRQLAAGRSPPAPRAARPRRRSRRCAARRRPPRAEANRPTPTPGGVDGRPERARIAAGDGGAERDAAAAAAVAQPLSTRLSSKLKR